MSVVTSKVMLLHVDNFVFHIMSPTASSFSFLSHVIQHLFSELQTADPPCVETILTDMLNFTLAFWQLIGATRYKCMLICKTQ